MISRENYTHLISVEMESILAMGRIGLFPNIKWK